MTATIDMFNSRSMTNAINKIMTPEPIVLSKVFGSPIQHASDKIDIEIVESGQGLAQFASKNSKAKEIRKNTRTVKTITLPMTYEKYLFTSEEMDDYTALGAIYPLSEAERQTKANEWILKHAVELKNRVMRRREMLACAALTSGTITVSQDDIEFTISFGLTADTHIITLEGTDLWTNSASKPLEQIMDAQSLLTARCGYNADLLLVGTSAAKALTSNAKILTQLDALNNSVGRLDQTGRPTMGGRRLGMLGSCEVWLVAQKYKVGATSYDMFNSKFAVFVSSEAKNTGAFGLHTGPVSRFVNNKWTLMPVEFLLESKVDDDNTNLEWKLQQKSLPVISDPDFVYAVQVVA